MVTHLRVATRNHTLLRAI